MSLNAKKLTLCAGLIAGASGPFITGSYSYLTGFGEAEFNARRVYSVRASAEAAGRTLEQNFNDFLENCKGDIVFRCDYERQYPPAGGIWGFGSSFCKSDGSIDQTKTFDACMKTWWTQSPSDSFLAHANALMMAAPTLLPVARDFVLFFALAAAAILCWNPFMRWLRS